MRGVRLFLVLATALVGLAYLVFSSGPGRPLPTTGSNSQVNVPLGDLVIGEPLVWENLTIFPVSSKSPRQSDRFITLDEGLKAGTVEILEKGAVPAGGRNYVEDPFGGPAALASPASDPFATPVTEPSTNSERAVPAVDDPVGTPAREPDSNAPNSPDAGSNEPVQQSEIQESSGGNAVNELMVVNRSNKPLYLMPGEIIIGGDQDRTIAEELVIAPGNKPTAINVFCVEHGRWGGRDAGDYARIVSQAANARSSAADVDLTSSNSVAGFSANLSLVVDATQIAEQANSGKFVGSVGSLNKAARLAVQGGEGQGKVWDEVAIENAKSDVRAETGTFAGNYSEAEVAGRLIPFLKQLQLPISETPNVVGVIVAVNGEIESLDAFESTPLFKKLWPKLLKSYALDASNAELADGEAKKATKDDASRFLREIASAKNKREDAKGEMALSRNEGDNVLLFTAHERKSLGDTAGAMGGFGGMGGGLIGGAVHSAGFSK
jgi:ARG and Rhodanese-Phosphatase-superfamily-associated Protein domain